jgi:hypothetical protein
MVHSVRDLQVLEVLGGFRLHFEVFLGVWLSLGRISSVACSLEVFQWLGQRLATGIIDRDGQQFIEISRVRFNTGVHGGISVCSCGGY